MPPYAPLQRWYVARFVFECLFNLIRSCSSDCGPRIFEFPRKLDGNERLRRNQTLPRALPPSIPSPYFHAVTSVRADSQYLVLKMHMPQTSLRVNINVLTIFICIRARLLQLASLLSDAVAPIDYNLKHRSETNQ